MQQSKVLKKWTTEAGLVAMTIVQERGHINGYVKADHLDGHSGYEFSINFDELESWTPERIARQKQLNEICVHGGITLAGKMKDKTGWWFGFDTAHSGDKGNIGFAYKQLSDDDETFEEATKSMYLGMDFKDDVWRTPEYVEEQCESLAKQLKEIK